MFNKANRQIHTGFQCQLNQSFIILRHLKTPKSNQLLNKRIFILMFFLISFKRHISFNITEMRTFISPMCFKRHNNFHVIFDIVSTLTKSIKRSNTFNERAICFAASGLSLNAFYLQTFKFTFPQNLSKMTMEG